MNSFLNVVFRESPLDSPFMPKAKCSGIGAADIASGLFGFFGSAMNAIAQQDANTTNLKIARMNRDLQKETNAQNYKMFQEQNAWNEDMWNKQNDYNLPIRQAARLRAAGINPAVLGSSASTPAGSVNSQSAPQMVAPQMDYHAQPVTFDLSAVQNAVFQSMSMRQMMAKSDSEINYTNAKAEFEWQSMLNRLQQEANKAKHGSIEWEQANERLRLFKETYNAQKQAIENNATMTSKDIAKLDLDIASQQIQNSILSSDATWRDKINEQNWLALKIGIREAAARIENYGRDSALKAAQTAVERARKEGMQISNEQADALVEVIVDEAEANLVSTERDVYAGKFAGKYLPAPDTHQRANEKKHRSARERRKRSRIDRL